MGQILASSSTSNVSLPQNPVEQIPKEEPSDDQLKNGGSDADQLKDTGEVEEEEEEGECGFCLFMKGGGCRDSFIEWDKCRDEAEEKGEDVVEKCLEISSSLRECMAAHAEYYGPVIRAEKAAQEELERQADEKKKKDGAPPDSST